MASAMAFSRHSYPDGIVPGDGMIAPGTGVYPGGIGTPSGESMGTPTEEKGKDRDKKDQGMVSEMKAILVIEPPANAKLFIDDMPVKVTSGHRSFPTRPTWSGANYTTYRVTHRDDA